MSSSLRIIVTGLIAQYPLGGLTWHYLNYVLGLKRLGHDVYYIEDTQLWPFDPDAGGLGKDCRPNIEYLDRVMARHELSDKWAYRFDYEDRWFGLSKTRVEEITASADLLINVSGSLARPAAYRKARRMAFVDTDPVFAQIKLALRQPDFSRKVEVHDVWFSFGECLSDAVIDSGYSWNATRQPIVLSEWNPSAPRRETFTTVMNWTSYKDVVYKGQRYGQKDVEFKRFIDLPGKVAPTVLELAIAAGKTRRTPTALLASRDWSLVDPHEKCADFDSYQRVHRVVQGRVHRGQAGLRGGSQRLVQRAQCVLPRGRPACGHAGNRILPGPAHGRGSVRVHDRGRSGCGNRPDRGRLPATLGRCARRRGAVLRLRSGIAMPDRRILLAGMFRPGLRLVS